MEIHPNELKVAYENGENISAFLRAREPSGLASEETIEVAYDLQAGQYVKAFENPALGEHKVRYAKRFAEILGEYCAPDSMLEAGIGEGTTLSFVLAELPRTPGDVHGFDLSWSRLVCARRWLDSHGKLPVFLSAARLSRIPYADDSFDVVFTSHALEPNRGNEASLLRELHRVASKYLVLLEPAYELADEPSRARMDQHGYCRGLVSAARSQGLNVVRHQLLGESANPLNPTGITVIEKNPAAPAAKPRLICPAFGGDLERDGDAYYSRSSMRAYPILKGIPCLRAEKAIIAANFLATPAKMSAGV